MVGWLGRWPDRLMPISPNTHIQTCRRLMDIAISPHVMSAPNSLHTLRNGRLPTLGRREEGEREVILQIHLLYYTNPYSCEWCQKEFVTKINLKKKKKKLYRHDHRQQSLFPSSLQAKRLSWDDVINKYHTHMKLCYQTFFFSRSCSLM